MDDLETPYDEEISDWALEKGLSLDQARDRFIFAALEMGDVAPLCCFLLRGYVPALAVRQHIGLMLAREQSLADSIRARVHYRLEIKPRLLRRGPRRDKFEVALRNRRLGRRMAKLIEEIGPGSYLSAAKTVSAETGWSEQTVRDAYDDQPAKGKRSTK